jgi:hypothetical protein
MHAEMTVSVTRIAIYSVSHKVGLLMTTAWFPWFILEDRETNNLSLIQITI